MPFRETDPEPRVWTAAFEDGLKRLGWVQGGNIQIDYRWAGADHHRVLAYAAELVGTTPDILFTAATAPLIALHQQIRSIPIVFVQASDPVKLGIVASLARPGGNITGFVNFEHQIAEKWLELLRDTTPGMSRLAVLFDPENPSMASYLQAIESAAASFGVQLTFADVRNAGEIERIIETFARQSNGTLIVLPNAVTILHRDLIIALAAQHRLPAVYAYRIFASSGGFISYGVDLPNHYREAASYVDRILKGVKPGDLPVQLASKFELVINLKTAKALSLTIPVPSLQHADEVIE